MSRMANAMFTCRQCLVPRRSVRALKHLVRTFFGGSTEQVVNALIEDARPSAAELDRLAKLIEQARQEEA